MSTSFRNHIPTVDEHGKRIWIYPRKPPTGKTAATGTINWYRLRTYFSWFLLALMVAGPFIRIGGNPLLMFNIVERRFSIFGRMFWPQDLNIFAVFMVTAFIMIVLGTAVFGRIWCGWACPQTVLMEMVFRKIEYFFEGDPAGQKKLTKMPWNGEKIRKRGLKLAVFFLISFFVANWLLMYIIGSEAWITLVTDDPRRHIKGLVFILIFTFVFFMIFARFREQACTFICPYGRFQSVMLDTNSLVVAYDHVRGEGRGKAGKGKRSPEERAAAGLGDCIDCKACVAVCPTGIDIRNGIQMECVNCTNCIDACNKIMQQMDRPFGLVRYASERGIEERKKWCFTPRLALYCGIVVVLGGFLVFLLGNHRNVEVNMVRVPGSMATEMPDGTISNLYSAKLLNKTAFDQSVTMELLEPEGRIDIIGDLKAGPQETGKTTVMVLLPKADVKPKQLLRIAVRKDGEQLQTLESSFLAR